MRREEAVVRSGLWSGIARTAPGSRSAWHHHGGWHTIAYVLEGAVRLESGTGGRDVVVAGPGDFLSIPAGVVHREANPADVEQALVIVRTGSGPIVVPVDEPPTT
jgi:uncharacterized RmlC-like cupin family protein